MTVNETCQALRVTRKQLCVMLPVSYQTISRWAAAAYVSADVPEWAQRRINTWIENPEVFQKEYDKYVRGQ